MLKDRWMIYEYLKKNLGFLNVNLIKGVDEKEIFEGINEYLFWLDKNKSNDD